MDRETGPKDVTCLQPWVTRCARSAGGGDRATGREGDRRDRRERATGRQGDRAIEEGKGSSVTDEAKHQFFFFFKAGLKVVEKPAAHGTGYFGRYMSGTWLMHGIGLYPWHGTSACEQTRNTMCILAYMMTHVMSTCSHEPVLNSDYTVHSTCTNSKSRKRQADAQLTRHCHKTRRGTSTSELLPDWIDQVSILGSSVLLTEKKNQNILASDIDPLAENPDTEAKGNRGAGDICCDLDICDCDLDTLIHVTSVASLEDLHDRFAMHFDATSEIRQPMGFFDYHDGTIVEIFL